MIGTIIIAVAATLILFNRTIRNLVLSLLYTVFIFYPWRFFAKKSLYRTTLKMVEVLIDKLTHELKEIKVQIEVANGLKNKQLLLRLKSIKLQKEAEIIKLKESVQQIKLKGV